MARREDIRQRTIEGGWRRLTRVLLVALLPGLVACMEQPLREGDEDRVLKIGQLAPYGLALPPGFEAYESFRRERWFDGSTMIEYEFEAPEEVALPYLYSLAERHPSRADACVSFAAGNLGTRLGGVEVAERDDLFEFGDRSRFGFLVVNGEPYGNYFGMCRDKTAFLVILAGFYFDDGEAWGELMKDTLEAVHKMN